MFSLVELADRLDIRRVGQKLLHHDKLFEDYMRPCPDGCGVCHRCQVSYETIIFVLGHENCTVFSVEKEGDECGVIYFTGPILHGCFFDGKLFGKAPAIHEACERMKHMDVGTITCQVPEHSRPLAWWLKKHGFSHVKTKEGDFEHRGNLLDVEVLEL